MKFALETEYQCTGDPELGVLLPIMTVNSCSVKIFNSLHVKGNFAAC